MLFRSLHAINLNILQVKGRSDLFLGLEIIKKIIGVISIAIVLYFKLGIMGLIWALVINSYIAYFINSYYSAELLDYSTIQQIKDVIPAFILSIFMGIVVYFSNKIFLLDNLLKLILQIIIGITVYVFLSITWKMEELKTVYEFIGSVLKRLKLIR